MHQRRLLFVVLAVFAWVPRADGQSGEATFQAGVQLAGAVSSEFDSTDLGIGGRVSWHSVPLVGVEAELDLYPGDFADEPAFSRRRIEGLFGATVGPWIGRLRPFARIRPGFVTFEEAPEPIACILIFPPPLACTLAAGRTVFALDVGGGAEWLASDRAFVRVDAGDRILRYPAPAIDGSGAVQDGTFSSHDFRFAIGAGIRF